MKAPAFEAQARRFGQPDWQVARGGVESVDLHARDRLAPVRERRIGMRRNGDVAGEWRRRRGKWQQREVDVVTLQIRTRLIRLMDVHACGHDRVQLWQTRTDVRRLAIELHLRNEITRRRSVQSHAGRAKRAHAVWLIEGTCAREHRIHGGCQRLIGCGRQRPLRDVCPRVVLLRAKVVSSCQPQTAGVGRL